jgi:membrane-associated phospholipid phosphatase
LRIPVAVFSAMIILSTLTTGWHYFIDVLGGLVLATASLAFAKFFLRYNHRSATLAQEM